MRQVLDLHADPARISAHRPEIEALEREIDARVAALYGVCGKASL